MKLAMKTAAKQKLQKAKQMSIQGKRKRLVKKIKKSCKEATNEVHEGVTFSKYAELDHDKEQEPTKTTEIPQRLTLPREKSYTYVTFDIETTGRGRDCEILQIAAGEDFNVYVHPRCNITEQASLVNGIQYNRDTNTMFHKGSEVRSKPIQDALLNFIDYIREIPEPILVGHNVCNFDLPIIANKLKEFNLFAEFSKHIVGFVDTLKIARRVFKKSEVGNFQQENLVNKLTNCTFSAHDAKEDVRALTVLFAERLEKEVQDEDLFHISFHDVKKKYSELLQRKNITVAAAQKLARSGIMPYHLQLAHGRNLGLKLLLDSFHVLLTTKYWSALVRFLEKEE